MYICRSHESSYLCAAVIERAIMDTVICRKMDIPTYHIFYLLYTLDIRITAHSIGARTQNLIIYHAYPGTTITVLWLPEFNRSFGYTLYPVRGASVGYNVMLNCKLFDKKISRIRHTNRENTGYPDPLSLPTAVSERIFIKLIYLEYKSPGKVHT